MIKTFCGVILHLWPIWYGSRSAQRTVVTRRILFAIYWFMATNWRKTHLRYPRGIQEFRCQCRLLVTPLFWSHWFFEGLVYKGKFIRIQYTCQKIHNKFWVTQHERNIKGTDYNGFSDIPSSVKKALFQAKLFLRLKPVFFFFFLLGVGPCNDREGRSSCISSFTAPHCGWSSWIDSRRLEPLVLKGDGAVQLSKLSISKATEHHRNVVFWMRYSSIQTSLHTQILFTRSQGQVF